MSSNSPRKSRLTVLNQRRLANFVANRRGYWSSWIIAVLFLVSLFAELVANNRPLLVSYKGALHAPVLIDYPETTFGGVFETPANYDDSFVRDAINADGWMVLPLIPFSYDTIDFNLGRPAPATSCQRARLTAAWSIIRSSQA